MAGLKDCLMRKNVSDIMKAQANITSDVTSTSRLFLPVIDHHFLQGEVAEVYQTHLFIPPSGVYLNPGYQRFFSHGGSLFWPKVEPMSAAKQ